MAAKYDRLSEKDQSTVMDLADWWRAVGFAFAWTVFQSLVLVDLLKVLMLTLTSPVFMHRLPPGSLRRVLGTQLLRNAHKALEGIL